MKVLTERFRGLLAGGICAGDREGRQRAHRSCERFEDLRCWEVERRRLCELAVRSAIIHDSRITDKVVPNRACTRKTAKVFAAFAPVSPALYPGTKAFKGCQPGKLSFPLHELLTEIST